MSRALPWPEGVLAVEQRGPCWIAVLTDDTTVYVGGHLNRDELVSKAKTHESVAMAHRAVAAALTCREAPKPLGAQQRYTADDVAASQAQVRVPCIACGRTRAEDEPPCTCAANRVRETELAELTKPRPAALLPTAEAMALMCPECGHAWRHHRGGVCTLATDQFEACGCQRQQHSEG